MADAADGVPARLLDALIALWQLKNDAALARVLDVKPPVLSMIRHRRMPLGAVLLVRIHEASGLPVRTLRALMRGEACVLPDAQASE